jgi:hypothetical protein
MSVGIAAVFAVLSVAAGILLALSGLAWVQVVEVGLLQHFVPALAKWLPTGAAVAITTPARRAGRCRGALPRWCSPAGRRRWPPPG